MNTTHITSQHFDDVIANHTRNMAGKVAAITGTTSGTGYICAREIGRKGGTVLLLNRSIVPAQIRRLSS